MSGLLGYLVSQDPAVEEKTKNVHTNPHVIGGDAFLQAWYGNEQLSHRQAREIAAYLEEPRVQFGTSVTSTVKEWDPAQGKKIVVGYRDTHVWHCSLSLPPADGVRSEQEWAAIAQDFMDRMGFTEASGKAPARWVAIHHGLSRHGNDHVHIAASRVREDGTRVPDLGDFVSAQKACADLEKKYGLVRVEGRESGETSRGYSKAEAQIAKRLGYSTPAPIELATRVRAAAAASVSEAEWVRRMRTAGLAVRPRFAPGTTDVVKGYSVALKSSLPSTVKRPPLTYYGGGTLGKDLDIDSVRGLWPEPTIEQATAASAEWQAAFRGKPPVERNGRETIELRAGAAAKAAEQMAAFNDHLSRLDRADRAAWAGAASDASSALSAWARQDREHRDELTEAARVLARSASTPRGVKPVHTKGPSPRGAALLFAQSEALRKGDRKVATAILTRQLIKTAEALRDYQMSRTRVREAVAIQEQVVARLQAIPATAFVAEGPLPAGVRAPSRGPSAAPAPTVSVPGTGPDRDTSGSTPLPAVLPAPREHENAQPDRAEMER